MDEDVESVRAHNPERQRAYDTILVILTRMKPLVRSSIFTVAILAVSQRHILSVLDHFVT